MISLKEVVRRLRTRCPAFQETVANPLAGQEGQPATVIRGRVGGTADFGNAMDSMGADLKVPHAFVMPLYGQDISEFALPEQQPQTVRQYFAVIVCVDNRKDGGVGGAGGRGDLDELDMLSRIQGELNSAFAAWHPQQRLGPVRYSRDGHMNMDNARLWHQFEFFVEFIDDSLLDPDEEEAVNAIINDMDNEIPYADSILANLQKLWVQGKITDGLIEINGSKISWDDFWLNHAFCGTSHKTPAEIAALAPNYHALDVNPSDGPENPDDVRDNLDEGVDYVEPPIPHDPEFYHGTENTEPKNDIWE